MIEERFRRLVEDSWVALEAEKATDERRMRTRQLPIEVEDGYLAVAVDYEGHRHALVPIPSNRKVRSGAEGAVLHLRRRVLEGPDTYQAYADLACRRNDLNDLFTVLCVDIVEAAGEHPRNPVKGLYRVLDRWKALFHTEGAPLGPDQLAGLFGELTVLRRLLERDPSAHRYWRGPEGHHHDFAGRHVAFEVKTSTGAEGRRARIHGIDQLEPPSGGTLSLIWIRVRRVAEQEGGIGLVEAVESVLRICDDESAILSRLARAGYLHGQSEHYDGVCFAIEEEKWYLVDSSFPGLTRRMLEDAGLPITFSDVEYTIEFDGDLSPPLPSSRVDRMIDDLIQESA
ncbi:PD-(D/E)XK motif protein [Nocardiopsis halophila]|uniref:PD-(D/E)XK motif protein n=1 Tax=Nocardiopsis halophila TaxID=141692 RepID=UPI000A02591A|nr:PD-(D/E)XK motif protein [Nocardiopsis halophila]